jgi:hypothetical protein
MRITKLNVYLARQKSVHFIVEIIEGRVHTHGQFALNDSAARFGGTAHSFITLLLTYTAAETAIQHIPPSFSAPSLRYVSLLYE